jgi:hypothetical protein
MKNRQPHRDRRTNIHICLLCLIGFIILMALSCSSPRSGCYGTRHMSGYGLNQQTGTKVRNLINTYGGSWVKNLETGKVIVFNQEGKLIGYYQENN